MNTDSAKHWSPYGHNSFEDQRKPFIIYQNGVMRYVDEDDLITVELKHGDTMHVPTLEWAKR